MKELMEESLERSNHLLTSKCTSHDDDDFHKEGHMCNLKLSRMSKTHRRYQCRRATIPNHLHCVSCVCDTCGAGAWRPRRSGWRSRRRDLDRRYVWAGSSWLPDQAIHGGFGMAAHGSPRCSKALSSARSTHRPAGDARRHQRTGLPARTATTAAGQRSCSLSHVRDRVWEWASINSLGRNGLHSFVFP